MSPLRLALSFHDQHLPRAHDPRIADVANVFRRASNLGLNTRTSVIVPLGAAFSAPRAARDKSFLETHIPEWRSFAVTTWGKYLGLSVGPATSDRIWTAAFNT